MNLQFILIDKSDNKTTINRANKIAEPVINFILLTISDNHRQPICTFNHRTKYFMLPEKIFAQHELCVYK